MAQESSGGGQKSNVGGKTGHYLYSPSPKRCTYLPCTLADLSFPFPTTEHVPSLSGEDIRGDGSCFPALSVICLPEPDMIVSLGTV